MMNYFERLPNELVEYILSFIGEHGPISSLVCTLWNTMIKDKRIVTETFKTLNLVIWAKDNFRYYYPRKIFYNAAKIGNLEIVQYLYKMYKLNILKYGEACMNASKNGHAEVLKWLLLQGFECNDYIIVNVALCGDLELLKWIHTTIHFEVPLSYTRVCTGAAKNGNIEMLKYLHEKGYSWGGDTCNSAIKTGHLEVLKYLLENGCSCDGETWREAIISGNLEIIDILCEDENSYWDEESCEIAARRGRLDILKLLRNPDRPRGLCPWDERTLAAARRNKHTNIIEWLNGQHLPRERF